MTWPWMVSFLMLWATCLLVLFIVLGQARRFAGLFEAVSAFLSSESGKARLESVEPGDFVVPFEVADAQGRRYPFNQIVESRSILLFVSDQCPPCIGLLDELGRHGELVDGVPVRVIATTSNAAHGAHDHMGISVYFDVEGGAMKAFRNKVTPRAFLVEPDGIVLARGVPNHLGELRAMVLRPDWVTQSVPAMDNVGPSSGD